MQPQLITIAPDGSLQGLDFKNKGVNLRQFGRAKIERTSEITWNEDAQKWQITFLHGTEAGKIATYGHAYAFGIEAAEGVRTFGFPPGAPHEPLHFEDYDRAVAAEVLLIQTARKNGFGESIAPAT